MEEDPHEGVHLSQIAQMNFLIGAGPLMRDLGFAPKNSPLPGDAVAHLLMAFADLKRGIVAPVLKPPKELKTNYGRRGLSLHERHVRVRPAVLMELLIMDGYQCAGRASHLCLPPRRSSSSASLSGCGPPRRILA